MRSFLFLSMLSIGSVQAAISQNDITQTSYPEAFDKSVCVLSSQYFARDFSGTKWKTGSAWRFHMFEQLGQGYYAPSGKHVTAFFNLHVSTAGTKELAAKELWKLMSCEQWV